MKLSKKGTTLAIISILACILLISELTTGQDKHAFYTLHTSEAASIEHPYSVQIMSNPIRTSIIPYKLSEQEVQEWFDQEEIQQALFFELAEPETNLKPQVPSSILELNDILYLLSHHASFYPIHQTVEIPYSQFVQHVDSSRVFFQEEDHEYMVPFYLEGLWVNESRDSSSPHQSLYLQGTFELNRYKDEFEGLLGESQARAYHTGYPSLLSHKVNFGSVPDIYVREGHFQSLFISMEEGQQHFLLETYLTINAHTRALLSTDSQLHISFFPTGHAEQESPTVTIPVNRILGQGYSIHTSFALSPTLRLRFEELIQYDTFFIFVATLEQSLDYEHFLTANFMWSDGKNKYRASSVLPPIENKVLFVSENPSGASSIEKIELETFDALSLFDLQVSIPLEEIKKEPLMSFLGHRVSITEIKEPSDQQAFPKFTVLLDKNAKPKPFPREFTVEYNLPLNFYVQATSKTKEDNSFYLQPRFEQNMNRHEQQEVVFSIDFQENSLTDEVLSTMHPNSFVYDDYTFALYLPTAYSEMKLKGQTIPLRLNKNEHIYSPR